MAQCQRRRQVRRLEYSDIQRVAAVRVFERKYRGKGRRHQAAAGTGPQRLGKRQSTSNASPARPGRRVLADDLPGHAGRGQAFVCRWHRAGNVQGDRKHRHPHWRDYRELRARRCNPNR